MSESKRQQVILHQALPSLSVTEWALEAGYDGVLIDMQHGEIGLEQACTMLRAAPGNSTELMVRLGSIEAGPITRLLDSGAISIVAPTVETVKQAELLVQATKYPPIGSRSLGPSRPRLYQGDSYTDAGNLRVKTIVQLETAAGIESAEEIISVPGIDAVYVGPADLAVSYGLPGRADWKEGPVWDATQELSKLCRSKGVDIGTYCSSPDYARDLFENDIIDFAGVGIDLLSIARMAESSMKQLRGEV